MHGRYSTLIVLASLIVCNPYSFHFLISSHLISFHLLCTRSPFPSSHPPAHATTHCNSNTQTYPLTDGPADIATY